MKAACRKWIRFPYALPLLPCHGGLVRSICIHYNGGRLVVLFVENLGVFGGSKYQHDDASDLVHSMETTDTYILLIVS